MSHCGARLLSHATFATSESTRDSDVGTRDVRKRGQSSRASDVWRVTLRGWLRSHAVADHRRSNDPRNPVRFQRAERETAIADRALRSSARASSAARRDREKVGSNRSAATRGSAQRHRRADRRRRVPAENRRASAAAPGVESAALSAARRRRYPQKFALDLRRRLRATHAAGSAERAIHPATVVRRSRRREECFETRGSVEGTESRRRPKGTPAASATTQSSDCPPYRTDVRRSTLPQKVRDGLVIARSRFILLEAWLTSA